MKSHYGKLENYRSNKTKPYAKKSFGQNFLVDENYIDKIIAALNPQPDETIIEIGAGRGALTEYILTAKSRVIAIELERDMIDVLRERFSGEKNFELIESDVLKIDFKRLPVLSDIQPPIKVVANLPYYISTAILQKLIEEKQIFSEMILMFQREVVERITAEAGNSERGFLTVLTEAHLNVEKLFDVPPDAFRPPPKVWSSVARLTPKREETGIDNEKLFRSLISVGFGLKRKTILNNLKNLDKGILHRIDQAGGIIKTLSDIKIESSRRAETLSIEEWIALLKKIEQILLDH